MTNLATAADSAAKDIATRAGKTFVQGFVGVVSAAWVASGFSLTQITNVSADGKLLFAVGSAVVASAASAVWNATKAYSGSRRNALCQLAASKFVAEAEAALLSPGQTSVSSAKKPGGAS